MSFLDVFQERGTVSFSACSYQILDRVPAVKPRPIIEILKDVLGYDDAKIKELRDKEVL